MSEENDLEAVDIITEDLGEAQNQMVQANECFKAQAAIVAKLKEGIKRTKEKCESTSSANLKLQFEITNAEQVIKSLQLAQETIKTANVELRKELLLSKDKKRNITERLQRGEKKYDDMWLECKTRYESIPRVQELLKAAKTAESLKNQTTALDEQAETLYKEIKAKREACLNVDKKRIIQLAEFMVHERPKLIQKINEKSKAITDLTNQLKGLHINVVAKTKVLEKVATVEEPKVTETINENQNIDDNPLIIPKLQLDLLDFDDLSRVKLDQAKMKKVDYATGLEGKESYVDLGIFNRNNTSDLSISPYFFKQKLRFLSVANEDNGTKNYSRKKLITILEDVKIDMNDTMKIISNVNPENLQSVKSISAEEKSDEYAGLFKKKVGPTHPAISAEDKSDEYAGLFKKKVGPTHPAISAEDKLFKKKVGPTRPAISAEDKSDEYAGLFKKKVGPTHPAISAEDKSDEYAGLFKKKVGPTHPAISAEDKSDEYAGLFKKKVGPTHPAISAEDKSDEYAGLFKKKVGPTHPAISAEDKSDEYAGLFKKKVKEPIQSDEIEEIDVTSSNAENLIKPPTQFLDETLNTQKCQELKKTVSFDLSTTSQNNAISENTAEAPEEHGASEIINRQLEVSDDESYTKIKDMVLKKHNMVLSPSFVYAKNTMLQMKTDEKIVTSKFFKSNNETGNEQKENDTEKHPDKIENETAVPAKETSSKILELDVGCDTMVASAKKRKIDELSKRDKPFSGYLFSHTQGLPESLDLSMNTTGYEDGDLDISQCIDASLLLSPKADLPMGRENPEGQSLEAPNFLTGLRKTGSSFFKSLPADDSKPDSSAATQKHSGFNFNFGGEEKKNRGGFFNWFQ